MMCKRRTTIAKDPRSAPLAVRTGLSGGFSNERISASQRPRRVHEALSEACNTWHQARLPSTSAGTSATKALNVADRKGVVEGQSVSIRVDPGGSPIIKKKQN